MREEVAKSVREELCTTLKHRLEAMRKYHERLTRDALESMRDWYKDKISALREGRGTDMRRLREDMEEAKLKVEKAKTEVEMTAMDADVTEAPMVEELSDLRGCDRKEEKEPAPMAVH